MNNGADGKETGVINLLRCPARFGVTIGKIFLADGLVQRRTNSAEIRSESAASSCSL